MRRRCLPLSTWSSQRILTTPGLFTLFLLLVILTVLTSITAVLLGMGAAYDLTGVWGVGKLRFRGDGLVEAWVAGVGAFAGIGGILFVSVG